MLERDLPHKSLSFIALTMQKEAATKFPFEVVDNFKIKSKFKLQLMGFNYQKEEHPMRNMM